MLMGFVGYLFRGSVKLIFLGALVYLLYLTIKNRNRNHEVLIAASYVIGFEVFSRMTGGVGFSYEFAKFAVIGFLLVGMFYRGFNTRSWPYVVYVFLLMPAVLVTAALIHYGTTFLSTVTFNLSGPVCLGVSALYCYDRKITRKSFHEILNACLYPIVAMTVYLYFFTPDIRDVLTGTQSNYEASGGFGPNQVATVLGLGMFLLFARLFLFKNKLIQLVDLSLIGLLGYRAFVTFSRGGVIVALVCASVFLIIYFRQVGTKERFYVLTKVGIVAGVCIFTWLITSVFTSGLIDKRYANQDAAGREKADVSTGRRQLIAGELEAFKDSPFIGIGVGRSKEVHQEKLGYISTTHNEVSRMLSEHGILGIFALGILLLTPLVLRSRNRSNLYLFSFLAFWFLTINHSSMRIAAPAFIYGLSVLSISNERKEEDTLIHRE
ncbi:MAG: hypothetical protein ACI825_001201 [Planctomycetota bacterium]|jgi:hypothetical protein|uniref:O-antigen ligase family protein n=1 Tax=Patiriisocius sp. Uisw_047 TaxID=3230969 RepID=UPI0039EC3D15